MKFSSKQVYESTVFPGVSFTLRRMSSKRRSEFNLSVAPALAKLRKLGEERQEPLKAYREAIAKAYQEMSESGDFPELLEQAKSIDGMYSPFGLGLLDLALAKAGRKLEVAESVMEALKENGDKANVINENEFQPALVRWGVGEITGLEIDGQPATPDLLLSDGPPELTDEIAGMIDKFRQMSTTEIENFVSPTTSGAVVSQAPTTSIAPNVSNESGSPSAIAASTSPS